MKVMSEIELQLCFGAQCTGVSGIYGSAEGGLRGDLAGHSEKQQRIIAQELNLVGELVVKERDAQPGAAIPGALFDSKIKAAGTLGRDRANVELGNNLLAAGNSGEKLKE